METIKNESKKEKKKVSKLAIVIVSAVILLIIYIVVMINVSSSKNSKVALEFCKQKLSVDYDIVNSYYDYYNILDTSIPKSYKVYHCVYIYNETMNIKNYYVKGE
jgi:flagellar basal body-associated protein FliL